VDQSPVFDHKQVRVEDGGVLGANRFRDFLLHLEDLDARLDKRGLEPRDLVSNLRRLNVITDNVIEILANDVNDGSREAGRDACSAKSNFLVIAAHPRASVARNQSSWKRALINSSKSDIALAASGPSQRMWSFDPWPAASIINPMMLLPFTSSPSLDTQISARWRPAIRTNIAPGRPSSPPRFPT